ncbi:MAG: hypothetical protein ACJA04_001214 [Cellvibrionaceae bacterium]
MFEEEAPLGAFFYISLRAFRPTTPLFFAVNQPLRFSVSNPPKFHRLSFFCHQPALWLPLVMSSQ